MGAMKRFLSFLLLSLCCGCEAPDAEPEAKPASAAPRKPASTVRTPPAEERAKTPPAFESVDAALAALESALAADDQDAIRGATTWLAKQGATVVGPAATQVQDSSNEVRFRLACLNVLGYLGPPAASAVIEATRSDSPQIRAKATDVLGSIHPSSTPIVSRLIELLDDEDPALRRSAVESLGRIGKPAERAAPKLQEILNSDADESLRGAAKTALKKIDPRIGFGKQ
jgi:HEAT repeat protein